MTENDILKVTPLVPKPDLFGFYGEKATKYGKKSTVDSEIN